MGGKTMNKKKISAIVFVVCLSLIVALAAGCQGDSGETSADNNAETVNFTDSAGRQVEVPAEITKFVPSGPMAQIVLFALAPDMMVGVSTEWSSEAEQYLDSKYYNLPVLGQFYGESNLNLEEIARVSPEVIIDVGESKSSIVEDMDGITEQVGIPERRCP
jgi:iron complex transport system substrate-binding protein